MSTPEPTAALPFWFRGLLIAAVTLTLCSCQAPARGEELAVVEVSDEVEADEVEASDAEQIVWLDDSPSDAAEALGPCPTDGCDSGNCNDSGCQGSEFGPSGCNTGNGNTRGCGCRPCLLRGPMDEYLCDGGDFHSPAGVRANWKIDGLEQEDTIAHYDTLDGRVIVTPSNRVCIYAPRFGAVRRVVNASESLQRELISVYEDDAALIIAEAKDEAASSLQQLPPVAAVGQNPPGLLLNRQQAGELEARVVVRELLGMIKPYCNLQAIKAGVLDESEQPWLMMANVAAITWTGDQAAQVTIDTQAASIMAGAVAPSIMYADAQGRPCLRLLKLASTDHAKPGDEVEFTLRFDNTGRQVIGNVTIVDNLTTRLAYVPDTAEASVEANFSTAENGAGSLVLRWEITQPLQPGQGGVLQFRAKVR